MSDVLPVIEIVEPLSEKPRYWSDGVTVVASNFEVPGRTEVTKVEWDKAKADAYVDVAALHAGMVAEHQKSIDEEASKTSTLIETLMARIASLEGKK